MPGVTNSSVPDPSTTPTVFDEQASGPCAGSASIETESMQPSTLSFAMIGGGFRAIDHSYSIKKLGLKRRVVCDAREAVARKHAEDWGYADVATDYRSVLSRSDVDVVAVVLPHAIAGQIVLDALRAGKHV